MTMTFDIDRRRELTVFRLSGDVSFEAFNDAIDRYRQGGPTRLELYDCLAFSGQAFSLEQLNQLVETTLRQTRPRPSDSRTALVVTDPLLFGASRQYQSLANLNELPWKTGVFETIEDARRWLGLED